MLKQVFLRIKGQVIGVGFRAWLSIQAKKIGVTGWVRNVYDEPDVFGPFGGVEAVIQGDEEKIKEVIDLLKTNQSPGHIHEVETIPQVVKEIYSSFDIKK